MVSSRSVNEPEKGRPAVLSSSIVGSGSSISRLKGPFELPKNESNLKRGAVLVAKPPKRGLS